MLSDIENIDIMLGENHFNAREREGSLNSNLPRRSRSFASNESENESGNVDRNQRNDHSRANTEYDHNSVTANSSAEINKLSSDLNSRISREMDEMMNSVSDTEGYKRRDKYSGTSSNPKRYYGRIGTRDQKRMGRSGRETGTNFRSSAKTKRKEQLKGWTRRESVKQ